MKKSHIIQLVLSLIFGPLGLFYSNWVAGLIFTVIAVLLSAGLLGVGWFIVYPFVLIAGFVTVARFNSRAQLEERRHQELVQATRDSGSSG